MADADAKVGYSNGCILLILTFSVDLIICIKCILKRVFSSRDMSYTNCVAQNNSLIRYSLYIYYLHQIDLIEDGN